MQTDDRLRLKLLADAGFTLIPAQDGKAGSKILIRESAHPVIPLISGNDIKEDVHTVLIDKNKSRVHQANLLWSLASD